MFWMRPVSQHPITWLIKPTEQAEKQQRREAVSAGMAEAAFLFLAHLVTVVTVGYRYIL